MPKPNLKIESKSECKLDNDKMEFGGIDMTLKSGEKPLDQYYRLKTHFEKLYGPNAVILYQIGQFFEVYDKVPNGTPARAMQSLNMRFGWKKVPPSYFGGLPIHSAEDHIDRLVENGFTVVIVEQMGKRNSSQRTEDRQITDIRSPGTKLSNSDISKGTYNGNYIMSIHLDRGRQIGMPHYNLLVGVTVIDINTGKNYIYQSFTSEKNQHVFFEDIYRVIQIYSPKEVIITYRNQNLRKINHTVSLNVNEVNDMDGMNTKDFQNFILKQLELVGFEEEECEFNKVSKVSEVYGPVKQEDTSKMKKGVRGKGMNNMSNKVMNYNCYQNVYFRNEMINKQWENIDYQNQFLKKVFPTVSQKEDIVGYLGLERSPQALMSYLVGLQFLYEHNPGNMKNLFKPVHLQQAKHLILNHNTLYQLNIIENKSLENRLNTKFRSLFDVIRHTCTSMGSRLMKQRLLCPIHDVKELNNRYELIEKMIKLDKKQQILMNKTSKKRHLKDLPLKNQCATIENIKNHLHQISDIESLHRRIVLNVIHPSQFVTLDLNYHVIDHILNIAEHHFEIEDDFKLENSTILKFKKFMAEYSNTFKIERMTNFDRNGITDSIFKKDVYTEIDRVQNSINESITDLTNVRILLGKILYNSSEYRLTRDYQMIPTETRTLIKDDKGEGFEYFTTLRTTEKAQDNYIFITKNRAKYLKKAIDKILAYEESESKKEQFNSGKTKTKIRDMSKAWDKETIALLKDITFINQGSTGNQKIVANLIEKKLNQLKNSREKMTIEASIKFREYIQHMSDKYRIVLKKITQFIEQLDVVVASASVSILYNYVKPEIKVHPIDTEKSYVDIKGMRHPIGERINTKTEYIANDVKLGIDEHDGILLFGVNGVGKSTCSKAIGLSICLAQMGMFVPATKFTYYPYKHIYARVNGMDNIFKSQSSFIVEMNDIRTIIHHADKNSLVVGDELGNTTENHSGLSIVATLIERLANNQSSFIFATHIHDLATLEFINKLKNIRFYHLKVHADTKTKKIIYERKLESGPGDSIYGLEIAQCVLDDDDFSRRAYQIRRHIEKQSNELIVTQPSKYNSLVFRDHCQICSITSTELSPGYLEVHHIKFQCMIGNSIEEQNGFNKLIEGVPKNEQKNLVVLCPKHHREVHHGGLCIKGYKDSSTGRILDYEFITKKEKNEKKRIEPNGEAELEIKSEIKNQFDMNKDAVKHIRDYVIGESKLSQKNLIQLIKQKYDTTLRTSEFNKIVKKLRFIVNNN